MYSKLVSMCPTRLLGAALVALLAVLVPDDSSAQQPADDETSSSDAPMAGYDGGFFIDGADGDFRINIGGRVQTQLRTLVVDNGDDHDLDQLGFRIRRARLKIKGHAFSPRLTYQLQPELAGDSPSLRDYFFNYEFLADTLEGRVGQWRYPFLRQEITSSGSLMLVDRSLVGSTFGDSFDTGVALHNRYKTAPVSWVVGVFNGATSRLGGVSFDNTVAPSRFGPAVVARAAYNYGPIKAYSEGDLEGGPLRFSVGGAVSGQPGIDRPNQSEFKATLDYMLKVEGFSTSGAAVLGTTQEGDGLGDQETVATGFFAQAGYLINDFIQPAVRYSQVRLTGTAASDDESDDLQHEALGGLNLYFYGHRLKWQTDAGAIVTDVRDRTRTNFQARTQLQLAF
ncbi:MAG: porin [Persicimonas sp.]